MYSNPDANRGADPGANSFERILVIFRAQNDHQKEHSKLPMHSLSDGLSQNEYLDILGFSGSAAS